MPFIDIKTNKSLTEDMRLALKSEIGQAVYTIPGKEEATLMINIQDSCDMYFGGKQPDMCYIDVKLHTVAPMDKKSEFIQQLFDISESKLGIEKPNTYITISEFLNWGANGSYV